ncbi:hypothetical protein SEUCBS139899_001166 [Sporothrix eucalyptigena]|uniref:Zn(2)-C6 fungal-type domain-containing protein n=1 Tax=Sporothrix eucalyptigena TaxID=1812306 RepID=A0ABP0B5C1_9PEZI
MKSPVVTCDACKRLKLKCAWDRSPSFQPACARCQMYGLPCLFDGCAWTAAAVKKVVESFPGAPSRRLFWGAASNAGGHPLDLHREAPPPQPQPHTLQAGFTRPLSPGPDADTALTGGVVPGLGSGRPARPRPRLLINSNMRAHLYDVFFTHIQPAVPVITRRDLEGGVPTLLDAAILGLAARHHRSISSTRDFLHIRDVILEELQATLCNFRRPYVPQMHTVQALLIILQQLELCTRTHDDLPSISLRVALACRMVQELGFHRSFDGDDEDSDNTQNLDVRQNIWAVCVFVDTVHSAAFGQTAHIAMSVTHGLAEHLVRTSKRLLQADDEEALARARFLHLVALLCGLRWTLRCFFSVNTARTTPLRDEAETTMNALTALHAQSEDLLRSHPRAYDDSVAQLMRLLAANSRVLYAVGLRTALSTDAAGSFESSDPLLVEATATLVEDACQIVEWTTPTLLRTALGQTLVVLYATSRALMVVVDALRMARVAPVEHGAHVARLEACTRHAASLMQFLLRSGSWSAFWTQGHTIQAILARLQDNDGCMEPDSVSQATGDSVPAVRYPQPIALDQSGSAGSAGIVYASMPLMNTTLPAVNSGMAGMDSTGMFSTNWDDFFFHYVQEYGDGWLQSAFAEDANDGDLYADYVFEDNNNSISMG